MDEQQVKTNIANLKRFWAQRNKKFKSWYEILVMLDSLSSKGLESYASNEPQTFYDMAHYLLTRGDISHSAAILDETNIELAKRARIDRGCQYVWNNIDRDRKTGGSYPFIDEFGFFLLVLGWYSTIFEFDKDTGLLKAQIWNPYDTYPNFSDGRLHSCVHSYTISEMEAVLKAEANHWNYKDVATPDFTTNVKVDDFWLNQDGEWHEAVLFDDKVVTGWEIRPEVKLLVSPVAGFPDKGSLSPSSIDWRRLTGRGIFEVNEAVGLAFNKWKTMVSQILRDTAQPITQEFSGSPQATPEQLTQRGALFHYGVGEAGLQRLPPAAIPIEIQAHMMEIRRELQKGSFNDAVYGMVEGQPGYALSMMASSSANQILYPYMDAKHFVIGEADAFWLSNLKSTKRVFDVKGKFIEKLKPTDIPEDVSITVESDVATPKDWLERGTVANYLKDHLDEVTILTDVLNQKDPQGILRRRKLSRVMDSEEALALEKIAGFRGHARFLEFNGDRELARAFKKMADALEAQMGVPAPGQAAAPEMGRVSAQRAAGAPEATPRAKPEVAPPETKGYTPQMLRNTIGKGRAIRS